MTPLAIAIAAAALGAALIGGLFFGFSAFIMRALGARPASEGMSAMVSINRVILRSAFMPVFFGTALLSLGLGGYALPLGGDASVWLLGGALAYLIGSMLITILFNVPMNNGLDRADPAADNGALWNDYLVRWTRWNHVRTVACLVSAALFMCALAR